MNTVHHHYNPDWLSDDALVANFVARTEEFTFLRGELARAPRTGTVQHYLLVGVRGAGKTTLLKRLAVAIRRDADLQDHLIALSFPEELYQVKNLSDFWWAACDALGDELDHLGQDEQAKRLDAAIDQLKSGSGKPPTDAGFKLLVQTCAELKRRPVLLVDNLDLVFQRIDKSGRKLKDPHAAAYWELREALSTAAAPIVIGGTVRLSEPFTDYDKAFYDFFIPKRLGKLALGEVRQVLERLADAQGVPEVKQRLHDRPSRIEALFELTGGNPRALGLIFDLLRNGPSSRAVEDFERLMDITTPYYKARFEDMSEQAQVIMHALAVRRPGDGSSLRFGHTAAEIGAHADLPTGTVSAQLDILEREGLVEKSAAHGRTQYRIAEQMFRLWLQMRSTRRIRQNVIDLTRFLEAMFDFEEVQAHMGEDNGASPLSDALHAFAVAGAGYSAPLRKGFEAYGADRLLQHLNEQGGDMGDYLSSADLSEDMAQLVHMREQLQRCNAGGLTKPEQEALLGSLDLKPEQKQASVQVLCMKATAQEEANRLRPQFEAERNRLLRYGMQEADLPLLFCKRTQGLLPLPRLTTQDADSACAASKNTPAVRAMLWRLLGARKWAIFADEADTQSWLEWGLKYANEASSTEWANVAGAMRRSKQLAQAQQVLEQAFKRGESSRAWYESAVMRLDTGGDEMVAEAEYRKAIALDPLDAWTWNALGNLLASKENRYDDAEVAYRKAIEFDQSDAQPWHSLGNLRYKLNRYDEAEEAYRKAIDLDSKEIATWVGLGRLLSEKLKRNEEAEIAYRKATEIEPFNADLWLILAAFLMKHMAKLSEAELAFRKTIELNPMKAYAWFLLGVVLTMQDKHNDEALAALRKAIDLDSTNKGAWFFLGILNVRERPEEALAAFERGAELDKDSLPWLNEMRANLQASICANAVKKALDASNQSDLRKAFGALLSESADIVASLVSTQFVELFLAPLLKNAKDAKTVLEAMRELGYEKHARPMLLAFEAAMDNRPDMLGELEPEIQGATKLMFDRLIGKKPNKKRAVAKKKKETEPND